MNLKNQFVKAYNHYTEILIDRAPEILVGIAVLLFFIFIGYILNKTVKNRLINRVNDLLLVNFIARITALIFIIIGILICLNIWGLGNAAGGLLAGAGVSAIVIGFAFKDIGENFLAGFFLAFSRPFSIGDIIEVEDLKGTVKALSFRNTHIRTFDGRDIYIPNSMLIKSPLINFTKDGLIRHDFVIGLDYSDNIPEAIRTILSTMENIENIVHEKDLAAFVTINEFSTSTINLKIYFWTNSFNFTGSTLVLKSKVMQQVVKVLADKGFSMPADIVELKIYQEGQPIPIKLNDFNRDKTPS